jgi:hypothetical protein
VREAVPRHHHHIFIFGTMAADKEVLCDQLVAMRTTESSMYAYECYLAPGSDGTVFNVSWREKICRWSYNVADQ